MPKPLPPAIASVRFSFERCCRHDDFINTFYHRLAAELPQIGPMFAETDMITQDTLVRCGISHLIDFADGVVGIASKLRELGAKHDRHHLDVPEQHYANWLNALIEAVRECDEKFCESLEADWRAVLRPGIKIMASVY